MTEEEIEILEAIARSRSEPARRVERAANAASATVKISRSCSGMAPLAALGDRPRPGKKPTITTGAKAWLVSVACDKAKDHGCPHEWTTQLLTRHAREQPRSSSQLAPPDSPICGRHRSPAACDKLRSPAATARRCPGCTIALE